MKVPDDCSVIGFDDISFARTFIPALTTIRQPRAEIGATAIRLLLERIESGIEPTRQKCLLGHALVVRESTAAA